MTGPIDHLPLLQWAGVIVPTAAVFALFIRLGAILKSIKDLEEDMKNTSAAMKGIAELVVELRSWRDAYKASYDDLLSRVRRLENQRFNSEEE